VHACPLDNHDEHGDVDSTIRPVAPRDLVGARVERLDRGGGMLGGYHPSDGAEGDRDGVLSSGVLEVGGAIERDMAWGSDRVGGTLPFFHHETRNGRAVLARARSTRTGEVRDDTHIASGVGSLPHDGVIKNGPRTISSLEVDEDGRLARWVLRPYPQFNESDAAGGETTDAFDDNTAAGLGLEDEPNNRHDDAGLLMLDARYASDIYIYMYIYIYIR